MYITITTAAILFISTITNLGGIQFLTKEAFPQTDLIGNTLGNNAPTIDIFNLTSGYTIKPVCLESYCSG